MRHWRTRQILLPATADSVTHARRKIKSGDQRSGESGQGVRQRLGR